MRAYYNDNDPFVVAWLRALMTAGLIPDGEIDSRSIVDVRADDLRGFQQVHLFAGIGGWCEALRLAGWPDDQLVWTGSCPCQPFSRIGRQRGTYDTRHLWPEFLRLVDAYRPAVVFGEQVAGAGGLRWFAGVRADLERAGYAVGAADLPAACVGSPHKRQRLYWVADTVGARLERLAGDGDDGDEPRRFDPATDRSAAATGAAGADAPSVDALHLLRRVYLHDPRGARLRLRVSGDRGVERIGDRSVWSRFEHVACADGWRRVEPGTFPLADGVSDRLGRLRGYGNAIVPQVAATFITAWWQCRVR